jgi:hypothetical protein
MLLVPEGPGGRFLPAIMPALNTRNGVLFFEENK